MSKSSLRKNQERTVTTNLSIGWSDSTGIAAGVVETGGSIYVVPRKAQVSLQRMLWTYQLDQDPAGDFVVIFGIYDHEPDDPTVDISTIALVQTSLLSANMRFQLLTAVGVLITSNTIEVDMKQMVLSRRSNLQSDAEFSIVPIYRSGSTVNVGSSGIMWVKETLFQEIFRDDLDEWAGYTFEESAS